MAERRCGGVMTRTRKDAEEKITGEREEEGAVTWSKWGMGAERGGARSPPRDRTRSNAARSLPFSDPQITARHVDSHPCAHVGSVSGQWDGQFHEGPHICGQKVRVVVRVGLGRAWVLGPRSPNGKIVTALG
jgi:hypothetical protein